MYSAFHHLDERPRSRLAAFVLVLVSFFICHERVSQSQVQLGRQTFSAIPTMPLRQSMRISSPLRFRMRVGGVAFSEQALGVDDLKVVDLVYDATRVDGERLVVTVEHADGKREQLETRIYDWMLAPIARFANSEYDACVSIVGDFDEAIDEGGLSEEQIEDYRAAFADGGRMIQYHKAFQGELLGLRLLQGDILLLTEDAAELFSIDDEVILGAGEESPDAAKNLGGFAAVQSWLDQKTTGVEVFFQIDHSIGSDGEQSKSWEFQADPKYTYTFEGINHEERDIDFSLEVDAERVDYDDLLDANPVVRADGLSGKMELKLICPEEMQAGDSVQIIGRRWLLDESGGRPFTSYVITDSNKRDGGEPIRFSAREGLLVLSGEPHWEMWDWSSQRKERVQQALIDSVKAANRDLAVWLDDRATRDPFGYLMAVMSCIVQSSDYLSEEETERQSEDAWQRVIKVLPAEEQERYGISNSTSGEEGFRVVLDTYLEFVVSEDSNSLFDEFIEEYSNAFAAHLQNSETEPEDGDIEILKEFSNEVSDQIRQHHGINPAVYQSLRLTMQYSALFRHFRAQSNDSERRYTEFVDSLSRVNTAPEKPAGLQTIETPTFWSTARR